MAKFNGFGGGGGFNMQQMMRQAQKMQEQMAQAQEELAELTVTGSAGGGMVEITLSGKRDVESVTVNPQAVDPDDVEMLEDLIAAALGDALAKVDEKEKELLPYGAAGLM
ncbi:MAG: YbaB/EbfC family nucleoid-associated protein [Clostridia bacterium]|jgi:DNA-binding YbaB/EbfC family protein|nr:YbaB/EbfC family nucleoid-associated protein [Clostridia bacterium]